MRPAVMLPPVPVAVSMRVLAVTVGKVLSCMCCCFAAAVAGVTAMLPLINAPDDDFDGVLDRGD